MWKFSWLNGVYRVSQNSTTQLSMLLIKDRRTWTKCENNFIFFVYTKTQKLEQIFKILSKLITVPTRQAVSIILVFNQYLDTSIP